MCDRIEVSSSSRRNVLKAIGAGLASLGVTTSPSAASLNGNALPTAATGKRIHHFRPDGDVYLYREQFVSPDLAKYGTRAVSFEERAVPKDVIPDSYRKTERAFNVQYEDTGYFGTLVEHGNAEMFLNGLEVESIDGAVDLQSSDSYLGPQYVYESAQGAEDHDVSERKAPINVAWNDNVYKSATDIDQYMNSRGWGADLSDYLSGNRFVTILSDSGSYYAKVDDEDVGKAVLGSEQYHLRLWDMGNYEFSSHGVCGQAHYDPFLHGKDHKYLYWTGLTSEPDWYLNDSRDEVLSAWSGWGYNTNLENINNDMDSFNGYIGTIHQ